MIKELHISNLAVILDTELDFSSSYVSLLGETGAGKSLVVDSLGLMKGDRSDFDLVRDRNNKAVVSAVFELSDPFIHEHPEVKEYLDGHELYVKRVLLPDRTNRSYLNGEPVSLNEYRLVTKHLIDIHSQGSNSDLLDKSKHLFYLDSYSGEKDGKILKKYASQYSDLQEKKSELSLLVAENKELDLEYLTFQIKEIEKYHLKDNEIEDLNEEFNSLRGYEKLRESYDEFDKLMSLPEGQLDDLLASTEKGLRPLEDTDLKDESHECIMALRNYLSSLEALRDKYRSLDYDPNRLDEINSRLFDLKGLQRKYGNSSKAILDKLNSYKEMLKKSDDFSDLKKDMETEIAKKEKDCLETASLLSKTRKEGSLKLEKDIGKEMSSLGLPQNGFKVDFTASALGPKGIDDVVFKVALNAGLDYEDLTKAASGGENSRLMLSLKTVLNSLDPYDLLVFDEIDTGVSGRIASLVAKKIRSISDKSQVLVISHLPQVVASANSYLKIEKKVVDDNTITTALSLDSKDAYKEVAKMLAGEKVTETALKQAWELIDEYHK